MTYAIEVNNLTVSYDQKVALRGVNLRIEPTQVVAVVGPNGAGKSTLLKAILGLIPVETGTARAWSRPIDEVRARIAYVPQRSAVDWDFPVTVSDVVLMGRYAHLGWGRRPTPADRERAEAALAEMEMSEFTARQIGELSGGQQQRVFLARALAQQADMLLLDEPFVGVDAATETAIFSIMKRLRSQGKTVVVVNHDLATVQQHFDSVVLINKRLVAYGPTERVFRPDILAQTYGGRLTILEQADQMLTVR